MYGKRITISPHTLHGCSLKIIMRPLTDDDIAPMVNGLQYEPVTRGTLMLGSPDEITEEKWLEKIGSSKDGIYWGIEVENKCIGITSIGLPGGKQINLGHTGKINFAPKEYWGKRIATATDMVRTWYGWYQHGLTMYLSEVFSDNPGSWKSLLKSGYHFNGLTGGAFWAQGQFKREYLFEWIHPDSIGQRLVTDHDLPWMDKTKYDSHIQEQTARARLVLDTVPQFIDLK